MTSIIFHNKHSRHVMLEAYERFRKDTPQAQSHHVSTRFGDTHLLVAGSLDAPPLIVLHGAMVNSALAIREGHSLLDKFRVYALDIIGQSVKSADVRLRMDNTDYGDWLQDVLDALKLPQAHIYGVSFGGFVARKLAELAPERIDRLVLLVPGGIVSSPIGKGISRIGIPLALYKIFNSQAALKCLVQAQFTTPDAAMLDYFGAALKHYNMDLRVPPLAVPESLKAFHRPTLVCGAADDIIVPGLALLRRVPEIFPHATLELLANWKHAPPSDDVSREKLCQRVGSFLLGKPYPAASFA